MQSDEGDAILGSRRSLRKKSLKWTEAFYLRLKESKIKWK